MRIIIYILHARQYPNSKIYTRGPHHAHRVIIVLVANHNDIHSCLHYKSECNAAALDKQ